MRLIAHFAAFCLAGLSLNSTAGAQLPALPTPPQPNIVFAGGRWFDGATFAPATWYSVGGRFTATRPERVDVTIDLTGRYVLPPFADAHNHDAQNPRMAPFANDKNLRQGVFYSVQMCSRPDQRQDFAGFFGRPTTLDVLYADACISGSDGHPLGIALASMRQAGMTLSVEEMRRGYDPVDTMADLDRLWPEIVARRPALIKLILINSERRAEDRTNPELFGYLGLDPALVAPIVARAHAAGIRVAAHADSAADFEIAVQAGADIVAHLPGYRIADGMAVPGYRIPDAAIAEAARRGTIVITTASAASHHLRRHPEDAEALRAMQVENLTRLRAAGVPLAIGSDAVMGTVIDEVVYLDELAVMPRAELLRRATMETPRAIFPARTIGAFREGAEASLVAFDGDPLADLGVLRSPRLRVKQGAILAD